MGGILEAQSKQLNDSEFLEDVQLCAEAPHYA